uniref:CCHC-type domain-containing protein n=1 Tax=Tanacetum cinerariifolium TaxID=118510 RepID=A0A6L2LJH3_TANCI|nr:hypothetical protein [Tanacetum cinerariifolium]
MKVERWSRRWRLRCGEVESSEDVVTFALEGLPDKYDNACDAVEVQVTLSPRGFSSSPMVFMADSGLCRFGNECKFFHDTKAKTGDTTGSQITSNNTEEVLVKLLGKLGLTTKVGNSTYHNNNATNMGDSNCSLPVLVANPILSPVAFHGFVGPTIVLPGLVYYPPLAHQFSPVPQPMSHVSIPSGFSYLSTQQYSPIQQCFLAQSIGYQIDRLASSLHIQGLLNDIYSLTDSNKNAKDLWDALARHMLGSEYGEQDRKAAVLAFNRRKFYSKPTNNNLRTSSASQSSNKKQEYVKSDDKKVKKKDDEKKRDMSKVKCYNCKKEGHFAKDYHAWMESSSDSDQEINDNMVFMAQIEKVLSDSEASSSSADDKISEVSYYLSESESESEYETLEYYDNTTTYGLFVNDNDNQEIFHDCENFPGNLIESQIDHNESVVDHNDSEGIDKARENKIDFAYDYGNLNASYVNEKINFLDDYFQEIINPDFKKIDSLFQQTSSLKPYVPTVILEKIIIDLEDEVVSLLDKEKENLKIIESLKLIDVEKGVESSEKVVSETKIKSENDCQVIEKVCDSEENPNVIAPGMFKLSVSQSISPISVTKMSCASNSVESKLKRKRR